MTDLENSIINSSISSDAKCNLEEILSLHANPSHILRLPQELLTEIIKFAIYEPPEFPVLGSFRGCDECRLVCNLSDAKACCLVSKAFCAVARPLRFRKILLPTSASQISLYSNLDKKSDLRKHRRAMSCEMGDYQQLDLFYWMAREVRQRSDNDRCLHIRNEVAHATRWDWRIIRTLIGPQPTPWEHISLRGFNWRFHMRQFMNTYRYYKLRTLHLDLLYAPDDNGLPNWERRGLEADIDLTPDEPYTCPTTTLSIASHVDHQARYTLGLLTWPKALVNFAWNTCDWVEDAPGFFPKLEASLSLHASTLKKVEITHLGWDTPFNATLFPNLETLLLSRWQFAQPLRFLDIHAQLLGPRLKTFIWDFNNVKTPGLDHYLLWEHFGPREANWVRELAALAVRHDAVLREIRVEFNPDEELGEYMRELEERPPYPWDRMVEVDRLVMRGSGRRLTFSRPNMRKVDWLWYMMRAGIPKPKHEVRLTVAVDDGFRQRKITDYLPRV